MMSHTKLPKFGVPVRVSLADKTQFFGVVFVRQGQRVIDLFCDERLFLPVNTKAGVKLLNKQHAVEIDLMSLEEMLDNRDLFPDVDFDYLRNNNW